MLAKPVRSANLPGYSPVSMDALVLHADRPPVASCMSDIIHNGMLQEAAPLQCRREWRGRQCEREEPLRLVHPRAQLSMCTCPETSGTTVRLGAAGGGSASMQTVMERTTVRVKRAGLPDQLRSAAATRRGRLAAIVTMTQVADAIGTRILMMTAASFR